MVDLTRAREERQRLLNNLRIVRGNNKFITFCRLYHKECGYSNPYVFKDILRHRAEDIKQTNEKRYKKDVLINQKLEEFIKAFNLKPAYNGRVLYTGLRVIIPFDITTLPHKFLKQVEQEYEVKFIFRENEDEDIILTELEVSGRGLEKLRSKTEVVINLLFNKLKELENENDWFYREIGL